MRYDKSDKEDELTILEDNQDNRKISKPKEKRRDREKEL